MTAFKDTSIFQRIRECKTDCGKEIRVEGNKLYIKEENERAFIFAGFITNPKRKLKAIWESFKRGE